MADATVTAANVSADPRMGSVIRNCVAGATLAPGDVVYINSSGQAALADADVTSLTVDGVGIVVNSTDWAGSTVIASGDRCDVCVLGPVYGFSSLTKGLYYWVSKTAGKLADAAPTSGAYQKRMGYALDDGVTFWLAPGGAAPASV
jgi:hypothetical protein